MKTKKTITVTLMLVISLLIPCIAAAVPMPTDPIGGKPPAGFKASVADLDYHVKYQRAFEAVLWSGPSKTNAELLTVNNVTPYLLYQTDLSKRPVVVAVPAATYTASLYGQEDYSLSEKQELTNSPWRFDFRMYGWMAQAPVKIKAGDITIVDMPESFDSILDSLEFAAMFEIEAHKGPLGFFVSPIYYDGKASEHFTGPLGKSRKATLEESVWIIDYGVSYEVGRWRLGKNSDTPAVTVEPYAGFRFLHDNIGIKVSPGVLDLSVSKHYTVKFNTPVIGLRTSWDLTDRWCLNFSGDYGGWDVDHVNETYQGIGAIGYRFTMWEKPAIFFAGYRYLHIDYEKTLDIEVTAKGPLFGIGLEF